MNDTPETVTTTTTKKALVSTTEFALMVGLSERTIRKLIYDKVIPFLKLGSYRGKRARTLINPEKALVALEKHYGHNQ